MTAAPYAWTDALVTGGWIRTLSPAALKLVLALGVHVNGSTLEAWPGIDRLQELTGLSESTVRAGLAELRDAGLITQTSAPKGGRYRTYEVTVYTLRPLPLPPREYASENPDHTSSESDHASGNLDRTPPPFPLESLTPRTGNKTGHELDSLTGQFPVGEKAIAELGNVAKGSGKQDWRILVQEWRSAQPPSHASPRLSLEHEALDLANRLQRSGFPIGALQVREFLENDQETARG